MLGELDAVVDGDEERDLEVLGDRHERELELLRADAGRMHAGGHAAMLPVPRPARNTEPDPSAPCENAAMTPLDATAARRWLDVAVAEARAGLAEGGIPIGAALFQRDGVLLGRGHNRRVQDGDPSLHAETAAFRDAGRRRDYSDCVMVTTLSPCWYCSGLIRQFRIGAVVIGESRNFLGGNAWVAEHGAEVLDLDDPTCIELLGGFIARHPDLWNEDIGR